MVVRARGVPRQLRRGAIVARLVRVAEGQGHGRHPRPRHRPVAVAIVVLLERPPRPERWRLHPDHSSTNNTTTAKTATAWTMRASATWMATASGGRRARGRRGARGGEERAAVHPSLFLFVYNAVKREQPALHLHYLFYADSPCKVRSSTHLVLRIGPVFRRVRRPLQPRPHPPGHRFHVGRGRAAGAALAAPRLLDLDSDGDEMTAGTTTHRVPRRPRRDEGSRLLQLLLRQQPRAPGPVRDLGLVHDSGCGSFAYAAVVQFVTSLTGMLAFTPNTVLATEATPAEYRRRPTRSSSLIDSGDTASGWISAAIVSSLGLSFDSWVRLPEFIWVASACQLAALAPCPSSATPSPSPTSTSPPQKRNRNWNRPAARRIGCGWPKRRRGPARPRASVESRWGSLGGSSGDGGGSSNRQQQSAAAIHIKTYQQQQGNPKLKQKLNAPRGALGIDEGRKPVDARYLSSQVHSSRARYGRGCASCFVRVSDHDAFLIKWIFLF